MTNIRHILADIHNTTYRTVETEIVSYSDPYGADNALKTATEIIVLGMDEDLDDEGRQWFTWTAYDADGDIIWDTQAGIESQARASILARITQ